MSSSMRAITGTHWNTTNVLFYTIILYTILKVSNVCVFLGYEVIQNKGKSKLQGEINAQ